MNTEHTFTPSTMEELQHFMQSANQLYKQVFVYNRPDNDDATWVNLEKFCQIHEIDATNLVVTVGPAVKLSDLSQALGKEGLRFIPASTPFFQEKSVGEFYYEGFSNIASLKYGAAKHFLMGAEIVLPTGEMFSTGGKTVKNVTGYDTTRFMNSPYANFGITTKFLLKIFPEPETRRVVSACFRDFSAVYNFIDALKKVKILPVYLLWLDEQTQVNTRVAETANSAHRILFAFDGVRDEVAQHWRKAAELLYEYKAESVQVIDSDNAPEIRNFINAYTPQIGFALIDEIKLKYSDQPAFMDRLYRAARDYGIKAGLFGQIAEGKLCVSFVDEPAACMSFF